MKNSISNKAFINGDLYMEKTVSDEFMICPKPFLKALHIEYIEI
jgi:hypothetical protein